MSESFKQLLVDGKNRLGIWGCGYIGFTSMVNFAKEGVYVIGYDVDKKVVATIRCNKPHIPNLEYWLGFPVKPVLSNMAQITFHWADMLADDVRIHLIAVPTERNGEPWHEPLQEVISMLAKRIPSAKKPDLIMIESTLTPGMFERVVVGTLGREKVGKEFLVGIAPRRDWFDSPDKNLKTLTRVIGGTTLETSEEMRGVLGIVCDNLIISDAQTVELVKSVENSILHIGATYANQLAFAYPEVDIAEVMRLASTHWRIPHYYPSVGTGGYCIPVSSKYVRDGAQYEFYLRILKETIRFDFFQPSRIAEIMIDKTNEGPIGILGLSYKRDLKVHILSPSLRIAKYLENHRIDVKVFDPYYTAEEVQTIVGVDTFDYPEDLSQFAGLIIVPPHRIFGQTPKKMLFQNLRKGQVILDNEGVWEKWRNDFDEKGIEYHRVGDKGWCL